MEPRWECCSEQGSVRKGFAAAFQAAKPPTTTTHADRVLPAALPHALGARADERREEPLAGLVIHDQFFGVVLHR